MALGMKGFSNYVNKLNTSSTTDSSYTFCSYAGKSAFQVTQKQLSPSGITEETESYLWFKRNEI